MMDHWHGCIGRNGRRHQPIKHIAGEGCPLCRPYAWPEITEPRTRGQVEEGRKRRREFLMGAASRFTTWNLQGLDSVWREGAREGET